eukprot:1194386-Prorocentrum_minimum.AAC.1
MVTPKKSPTCACTCLGGESNPPVVEQLNRGLMDSSQLGHFFGICKYVGGESNSPVVERLNRGLMDSSQLGHFFGI